MALRFDHISHKFGPHRVFEDFSFAVEPGEIACLLGPSGCGKTTLLRIAAGLERQTAGIVSIDGRIVSDATRHLPPEARHIGLMFQDYALFPHLDVAANVGFGLMHLPPAEREARVRAALIQVGMENRAQAYPHTLSGGQQQRVALARALAPKPALMLLDEPFSGLDQATRIRVREETLALLKEAGIATLLVTHDPEEGMFMADRILVMGPSGQVLQEGTPEEVFNAPAHPFVASFFGEINRIDGVVASGRIETTLGPISASGWADGSRVAIVFREYAVDLDIGGTSGIGFEVVTARPIGRETYVKLRHVRDGCETLVRCRYPGVFPCTVGQKVGARLRNEDVFVYRMDDFTEA